MSVSCERAAPALSRKGSSSARHNRDASKVTRLRRASDASRIPGGRWRSPDDTAIRAISNFIECPPLLLLLLCPGREFVRRRETGVTRVRSFTPRAPRNTRERSGEERFPRTRLCLRRCRSVPDRDRRRQRKRTARTIKTKLGRARTEGRGGEEKGVGGIFQVREERNLLALFRRGPGKSASYLAPVDS